MYNNNYYLIYYKNNHVSISKMIFGCLYTINILHHYKQKYYVKVILFCHTRQFIVSVNHSPCFTPDGRGCNVVSRNPQIIVFYCFIQNVSRSIGGWISFFIIHGHRGRGWMFVATHCRTVYPTGFAPVIFYHAHGILCNTCI